MNMKIGIRPAVQTPEAKPQGAGAPPIPEDLDTLKDVDLKKDLETPNEIKKGFVKPARGVRFRQKNREYTLGEYDSLELVQKWVHDNEVKHENIEVLSANDEWMCFDKVMNSK